MNRYLKWTLIVLGSLLGIVLVAVVVLYFLGSRNLDVPPAEVNTAWLLDELPTDSTLLADGGRLATIHGCRNCHGDNLGGKVIADVPPIKLVSTNLTSGSGGIGADYSVQDFDRAIRYGTKKDGHRVGMAMPSRSFHNISNDDVGSIIAYIKSVPPVDNQLGSSELRFLGYLIAGVTPDLATLDLPPVDQAPPFPSVEVGATVEYGKYLAWTGCHGCHGDKLQGGASPEPGAPAVPSLSASSAWTLDQFRTTMRTGKTPGGVQLKKEFMPWPEFAQMTDTEIEAIHLYIKQAM